MENRLKDNGDLARRRYPRIAGPFPGSHIGDREAPVLIYDLNRGGGFVNFLDTQPNASSLLIKIHLPEGPITVNAETVYRHPAGVAVRFVDVDEDSGTRLARTVGTLCWGG
jgi:hypothetical protein